jgi:hypothetical protein
MTPSQLWFNAARDARDVVTLLSPDTKQEDVLNHVRAALNKSRSTTAALEALQRQLVGVPEPRRGE